MPPRIGDMVVIEWALGRLRSWHVSASLSHAGLTMVLIWIDSS
jgi:hypothetical protein